MYEDLSKSGGALPRFAMTMTMVGRMDRLERPPSRYLRIVKLASLTSETLCVFTLLTRIRACVVAGPVTVQNWLPLLATLAKRVVQVTPPSRERSIRTLPLTPLELHRIVCVLPAAQLSPTPLGAVTVRVEGLGTSPTRWTAAWTFSRPAP
jgi:hypothetical protein